MKLVIWAIFGLMALLWTGGAMVLSELIQWASQAIASGQAASLGRELAQWPVPQWVAMWVDPALIQAAQASVLWMIEMLQDSLPMLGSAVGWLAPLMWVGWGLGLVVMFLLAGGAHLLVGRLRPVHSQGQ